MKAYLAARFGAQQEMRGVRDVLTAFGHEVTSSWIDIDTSQVGVDGLTAETMASDPARCAGHAAQDMADLLRADTVIVFTQYGPSTTGGRDVEHGIALGAGKRVIVVGPAQNIFHTLPQVERFPDWKRLVLELSPAFLAKAGVA